MDLFSKLKEMKILLIDDDEWIRDSMSIFFESEGCYLLALETAEEGIEELKKEVFDKDIFTGKHTQEDAFLYIRGDIDIPDNLSVEHVMNLILGRDTN